MSSFDNFDSNGKEKHYTQINSMKHFFLEVPKIMHNENTMLYCLKSKLSSFKFILE